MNTTWNLCAVAVLAAGSAFGAPVITAVLDAGGYTPNIAQGSMFVVKGNGLCSSSAALSPTPYSKASWNGVKVTLTPTLGGGGTDAYMVYTTPKTDTTDNPGDSQLAAILPSTLPIGSYNVTVSYGGATSAGFVTSVVAHKFGVMSADSSGAGTALMQNYVSASQYDSNRYTSGTVGGNTVSPAHPGQLVIVWGTGLGPISSDDGMPATGPIDLRGSVDVKAIVGGTTIQVDSYAGRTSYPGLDAVYFTLPGSVTTGCLVPLQVSVGGVLSNSTYIAIAPTGATSCTDPILSTDTLYKLDQGGTLRMGTLVLTQTSYQTTYNGLAVSGISEQFNGGFMKYDGSQLAAAKTLLNTTNTCQVYHRAGTSTSIMFGASSLTLDAGSALTLKLASGDTVSIPEDTTAKTYTKTLSTVINLGGYYIGTPVMTAGAYQVQGTGGTDIGPFTAQVTLGTPLSPAALPTSITRSSGMTLTWTGGTADDIVEILGMAGVMTSKNVYDGYGFVCTTTGDKKSFTVPASVLSQMPAVTQSQLDAGSHNGSLMIYSMTKPTTSNGLFTAPLVPSSSGSVDIGMFMAGVGAVAEEVAYQ
jgi:uncharacterized protein (TIGR03437 family)